MTPKPKRLALLADSDKFLRPLRSVLRQTEIKHTLLHTEKFGDTNALVNHLAFGFADADVLLIPWYDIRLQRNIGNIGLRQSQVSIEVIDSLYTERRPEPIQNVDYYAQVRHNKWQDPELFLKYLDSISPKD